MDKPKILEGDKGLLLASLAGLVLSDIIPTPGDALYFHLHRKYRDLWTKGELTARHYWLRETLIYYTLNSGWWLLVGFAAYNTPGDIKDKLKTFAALTGVGVVVGVIFKNIQKDEKEQLAEQNLEKSKLYTEKNGKV